jgi:hypothetical protein
MASCSFFSVSRFFLVRLFMVGVIMCISGCRPDTTGPSGRTTSNPIITTDAVADLDRDGLSDALEDRLMLQFAPEVRFHPGEQYLPANVPWYLDRVRLRFDVNLGFDRSFLGIGKVSNSSLISQRDGSQSSGLSDAPSAFFLEQTDANGGDSLDAFRAATRQGPGSTGWICYAHVRPVSSGTCDIQYIFFYAYNGDLLTGTPDSAHEADMEHITVRVKGDFSSIEKVYYAAHDEEGKWYFPLSDNITGYPVTSDGRPVVYSALDSHASYPAAGVIDRGLYLPSDKTGEGGLSWDCRSNVINLGEKAFPRPGLEWLQYSGRWGEIGEVGFTRGPYGPAYQSWWDGDPK